jgi:hypothetical protein
MTSIQRTIASAASSLVVAAGALFAAPGVAGAQPSGTNASCQDFPDADWHRINPGSGGRPFWSGYRDYRIVTATPRFDVTESRTAQNDLDTPTSATFTSSQSHTFQVSVSVGATNKFSDALTATLNVTFVEIRTTTIGVSTTATVPPHSRVIADYGVAGYDGTYTAQVLSGFGGANAPQICTTFGLRVSGSGYAPTNSEGWRVRLG